MDMGMDLDMLVLDMLDLDTPDLDTPDLDTPDLDTLASVRPKLSLRPMLRLILTMDSDTLDLDMLVLDTLVLDTLAWDMAVDTTLVRGKTPNTPTRSSE